MRTDVDCGPTRDKDMRCETNDKDAPLYTTMAQLCLLEETGKCDPFIVENASMSDAIIASEAVYGFAAWLASRDDAVTIGAKYDAGVVAELAGEWVQVNDLPEPRNGVFPHNITMPGIKENNTNE